MVRQYLIKPQEAKKDLHRSNGLLRAGLNRKTRERRSRALNREKLVEESDTRCEIYTNGLMDITLVLSGGEEGWDIVRRGCGDDLGAVNEVLDVLTEDGKFSHRRCELLVH
jgi:hypothetical protein